MLQFTTKDILDIKYYLDVVISRLVFAILWSRIKKQTVYIDTEIYKFTYSYRKMWIAGFNLYALVATHNLKNFIVNEEFSGPRKYNVIFLSWN